LLFESLQKKWHFFVRGFQITAQKRPLGLKTAILAEKRIDSFARIASIIPIFRMKQS
jgi:hypothetical protein